jgi:uncharacterized protein (DUF433 family)
MLNEKPEETEWRQHIVSTPEVLSGKPRINGTRISVALVLGFLASGASAEEIMDEYPGLTREQISACLAYARELAEYRVV